MNASINLMSLRTRRQECVRSRLRLWSVALAALAGLMGLVSVERYLAYRYLLHRQLGLEAKYEPVAELKNANKSLTKQIAVIREEEEFVLALSKRESMVTLLGVLGEVVADADSRVFLKTIGLNNVVVAGSEIVRESMLEIAGVANSGPAVKELAESLQRSLSFGKVDVTSTQEFRLKQQSMQDFSLECTF
jgi:hypothetical protein